MTTGDLKSGVEQGDTITFDELKIPRFKNILHRGKLYSSRDLTRHKGARTLREGEHATNQRNEWKSKINKSKIISILNDKKNAAKTKTKTPIDNPVWKLRLSGKYYRYFFGDINDVASEMAVPDWFGKGKTATYKRFDVDHIVELQVANWPTDPWANTLENMELLESKANRSSGGMVKNSINNKITTFLRKNRNIKKPSRDDVKDIKSKRTLKFKKATGSGGPSVNQNDYWTRTQIEDGAHLKAVSVTSSSDIGGKSLVRIFTRKGGGGSREFKWSGSKVGTAARSGTEKNWLKPFVMTEKFFKTDEASVADEDFGYMKFKIPKNHPVFKESEEDEIKIKRIKGSRYGGQINRPAVVNKLRKLKADPFSPISLANVDIDPVKGINAHGKLLPDIPLLKDLDINLDFIGGELVISKEFSLDEFKSKIPKPFDLRALSLRLSYSTKRKFGFDGEADFGIHRIGEGKLKAGYSTAKGVAMAGNFSFVKSLFDPAEVGFAYAGGNWSASGKLGIKDGKVPGIKRAEVEAAYKQDEFSAIGTVETKIPGIESGGFEVIYKKNELMIGATLNLSSKVPLLKSGTAKTRLRRKPDKSWSVYASIQADLAIPGLKNSSLSGSYDDGIFALKLTTGFKYGLATGSATVWVTNQGVDDKGKPAKGQPSEELLFSGVGSVSVKLSKWLKAGAKIRYSDKGDVKIFGELSVPKEIPLFKAPKPIGFNKPRVRAHFPIFSIGVADIGIDLGGGLSVYAKMGNAVLRNVKLTAEYDFANPEAAKARGTAQFYMPAEAGLEGYVTVGVSGRLLIVKAGGELQLSVGASIKGAASSDLTVDWTRKSGFSVNVTAKAEGSASAYAKLAGRAYVDVDYWIGSKRVWTSSDYTFAEKRMGSGLKFGIVAPISYSQKEGFKGLSLSSIRFITPSKSEATAAAKKFVKSELD